MLKVEFDEYVSGQIALLTKKINDDKHAPGDPNDDVSRGKLLVYEALRKLSQTEKLSNQELGVIGAVNDTLQKLTIIDGKTTLTVLIKNLG